jgi:hypothetical protein
VMPMHFLVRSWCCPQLLFSFSHFNREDSLKILLNLSSNTTYVGLCMTYFDLSFVFFCCGREKDEEEKCDC